MSLEVNKQRLPLEMTKSALSRGSLTIGFIGGSITDARPRCNWPEPVAAWFVEHFPGVRVYVENAAIGATGSDLAVFRAEHDLIECGCDLVFVEFAVNDYWTPQERRMRTREGLLRKLIADGRRDVVLVHTFNQEMYADMAAGKVPASIAEFEMLGEHYGLGSVWMGLHALNEVRLGRMNWEEWLPDGLHPSHRGSLSYGESVISYLHAELIDEIHVTTGARGRDIRMPEPLNPLHWGSATTIDFAKVELQGPWTIRRWPHLEWIDRVLHTSSPGARLSFSFEGSVLILGFDFGKASAEFRWRLNGGEWIQVERDRPDWCDNHGWYRPYIVVEDLPTESARHMFELEVTHGDKTGCLGTHFDLALIGVVV